MMLDIGVFWNDPAGRFPRGEVNIELVFSGVVFKVLAPLSV